MMKAKRVYSLYEGQGDARRLIRWGVSRFGAKVDQAIEAAVCKEQRLGSQHLYIEWMPRTWTLRSAEQMRAQRIRNEKARLMKGAPLFFSVAVKLLDSDDYFSLHDSEVTREERSAVIERLNSEWWEKHSADKQVTVKDSF